MGNKTRQQEKERQVTAEFDRLQNQLSEDLRQQAELSYQKKFQEMQQSTRRNQIEEIQKSFKLSAGNPRKEAQETTTCPELQICWRCGEAGHKKKECIAICFVQTAVGTIILPVGVDKHSRKTVVIVKEMTTPRSIVQQKDLVASNKTRQVNIRSIMENNPDCN